MIDLNKLRAEFARLIAEQPNKRFSIDSALQAVCQMAYEAGARDAAAGPAKPQMPAPTQPCRVLVYISGGVASTVEDAGVDVAIFDFDDYDDDPDNTPKVPARFADLAGFFGAPVEGED